MALKWGILSAGNISESFVKSVQILPREKHEIVAVAARELIKAESFASKYSIPHFYGNYECLAKNADVEVVYIGSIHPTHFTTAKLMLENGKHVLCEKPMTMNEKDTKELIRIARERKLFLMEAVWSRCFPAYIKLQEIIKNGVIGDVKHVSVKFGKKINHVPRLNLKELGGGTVLDLGIYTLQFQQMVFGVLNSKDEEPRVLASGSLNEHGTDESANVILQYSNGKSAVLSTHSCVDFDVNEAQIFGEKGWIRVPYFYKPIDIFVNGIGIHFDLPKGNYEGYRPGGMSYEAEEVYNCIKQGLLESPRMTHEDSIKIAHLMDEILKQLNVTY